MAPTRSARRASSRPRARRGRPRSFDAERVLERAMEFFWKRGYRETTTRELEGALGLGASSLYNAFGSKEALLEAALARYEERVTAGLLGPLETSSDGLAALETFCDGLEAWVLGEGRRGCLIVNLMAEDGGATKALVRRTRRYRGRLRRALGRALERAAAAGELDPASDAARGRRIDLLVAGVLGVNIAARGGAPAGELRRLVDALRGQIRGWRRAPSARRARRERREEEETCRHASGR